MSRKALSDERRYASVQYLSKALQTYDAREQRAYLDLSDRALQQAVRIDAMTEDEILIIDKVDNAVSSSHQPSAAGSCEKE